MDPLDPSLDQELEGMPELPPDPIEEAIASFTQALHQMMQMQAQIVPLVQQLSQSVGALAAAVRVAGGPRKRIPVRGADGTITEAHDLPMGNL